MYQIIIEIDLLSVYGSHFVLANYCTSGQETNRANGWVDKNIYHLMVANVTFFLYDINYGSQTDIIMAMIYTS